MFRWPCSSREGGWEFEVLPSGVRGCIEPCACAPNANGSEGVISTAGFVKARFLVMNSPCPQECRASTDGDVLGLRFIEALQPTSSLMDDDTGLLDVLPEHPGSERRMGTSPPFACPWVAGVQQRTDEQFEDAPQHLEETVEMVMSVSHERVQQRTDEQVEECASIS